MFDSCSSWARRGAEPADPSCDTLVGGGTPPAGEVVDPNFRRQAAGAVQTLLVLDPPPSRKGSDQQLSWGVDLSADFEHGVSFGWWRPWRGGPVQSALGHLH